MSFRFQRRYEGSVQAVLLDWAGTTVDYGSCSPVAAMIEVFHRRGVSVQAEQVRRFMGTAKKHHLDSIARLPEVSALWRSAQGHEWSSQDLDQLYTEFLPVQLGCLAKFSDLIPGALTTIQELRARRIKIGTTTGYDREMMRIVAAQAERQGYVADAIYCADDAPQGRPAPWLAFKNMERLGIYPAEAWVKVGDSIADIEEGLNAGMWSVGLARSGNELGLNEAEIRLLPPEELNRRLEQARSRLRRAGAHFVLDSIAELVPVIDEINQKLKKGEKP